MRSDLNNTFITTYRDYSTRDAAFDHCEPKVLQTIIQVVAFRIKINYIVFHNIAIGASETRKRCFHETLFDD